ncbi:MAG TPA: DUF899 family protein [Chloroflexota bacterium]|nr:DUF899 family protein [Chloroflexota bacterium]
MGFKLNAFVRDGDEAYRTYATTSRGVDRLRFVNNIQDLAVYGRQEGWEDSLEGWPQRRPAADGRRQFRRSLQFRAPGGRTATLECTRTSGSRSARPRLRQCAHRCRTTTHGLDDEWS